MKNLGGWTKIQRMKKLDFYEDRPNKYTRTELTPNREFTAKPDLGPSDHKKNLKWNLLVQKYFFLR